MSYPECLQCKPKPFLVAFVVSKAFFFADSFVANVLSFMISIVYPTFSSVALVISKSFCFVSSTIETTLSFVSPTFS
jgi:hypothetical protein